MLEQFIKIRCKKANLLFKITFNFHNLRSRTQYYFKRQPSFMCLKMTLRQWHALKIIRVFWQIFVWNLSLSHKVLNHCAVNIFWSFTLSGRYTTETKWGLYNHGGYFLPPWYSWDSSMDMLVKMNFVWLSFSHFSGNVDQVLLLDAANSCFAASSSNTWSTLSEKCEKLFRNVQTHD